MKEKICLSQRNVIFLQTWNEIKQTTEQLLFSST